MSALISATELQNEIKTNKNLVLLDATYGQPVLYTIEGAIHFDIDTVADMNHPLPHMVPSIEHFEQCVSDMGINHDSNIVVFDKQGFWMAAARVWWMFRLFGHNKIRVLNGGLQSWDGELTPYALTDLRIGDFKADYQPHLIKNHDCIIGNQDDFIVVDARPAQAFDAGSIQNSISIPLPLLINNDCTLKTSNDLLSSAQNQNMPIVTSCGSGVTACALALAFFEQGNKDIAVYDGSWVEYSSKS